MKIELRDKPNVGEFFRTTFISMLVFLGVSLILELILSYYGWADKVNIGVYSFLWFVGVVLSMICWLFMFILKEPEMREKCIKCKKWDYKDELIRVTNKNVKYNEFIDYIHEKCLRELNLEEKNENDKIKM